MTIMGKSPLGTCCDGEGDFKAGVDFPLNQPNPGLLFSYSVFVSWACPIKVPQRGGLKNNRNSLSHWKSEIKVSAGPSSLRKLPWDPPLPLSGLGWVASEQSWMFLGLKLHHSALCLFHRPSPCVSSPLLVRTPALSD